MGLIPLSPMLLWWRRIASDNWGQQFVTVTCMKSLNLIMVKIANVLISSLNGNTKGHRTCEKHFVEQWHLITFSDTACSGWWKDEYSLLLVETLLVLWQFPSQLQPQVGQSCLQERHEWLSSSPCAAGWHLAMDIRAPSLSLPWLCSTAWSWPDRSSPRATLYTSLGERGFVAKGC